ncbi:MAG: TolC family protein [Ghiorsea sp.]
MSTNALAQDVQFHEVLQASFAHHPELDSARLQVEMRRVDQNQIEGMLDMQVQASLGLSDEVSPASSSFSPSGTSMSFISAQVVKPLADGSSLMGMVNYNRVELSYPSTVPTIFQATINPTYQHQIDLIYRYPLWKGAGNPTYQYQKDAANNETKAASFRIRMLKEKLAGQAIGLYFQLAFNDLSLNLAADAVKRAKQLLAYQKKREIFGLIEKADRQQAEAMLAARRLQHVQAVAARDAGQTALNRLMFQDEATHLQAVLQDIDVGKLDAAGMLDKAMEHRPVFAMLAAQYAAGESRLSRVKDDGEQQLDIVGQIGTRALDGSAGTAFAQGFTLDDRYVSLRLEFSDAWNDTASRAVVQRNVLMLESIQLERRKAKEELKTELANVRTMIRNSVKTLEASKALIKAEKVKYQSEVARYREGRSSTATMIQFEGDLRAAELRLAMQDVTLVQAKYQQRLIVGDLLPDMQAQQHAEQGIEVTP